MLARNFNRAAADYDVHAMLQDLVLDRLLEQIPVFRISPDLILDLGSGTGKGSARLKKIFTSARFLQLDIAEKMLAIAKKRTGIFFNRNSFICADADVLPITNNTLDLVFTSLMMQWSLSIDQLFGEIHRVMKPSGLFLFATLGPETLHELNESWQAADDQMHVHVFPDIRAIGDLLVAHDFAQPVLESERLVLTYADVKSVMQDLKHVGAVNSDNNRRRTLTGKQRYQRCVEAYEQFRQEGKLPATYEIIYGHAWKDGSGKPKDAHELRFVEPEIFRAGKP